MRRDSAVPTEQLLKNFGGDYKVIFVGDALMDLYELMNPRYDWKTGEAGRSGLEWLRRFAAQYPHLIWLNPEPRPDPDGYWGASYGYIDKEVAMFPLSVDGLGRGMKKLLVRR